MFFGCRILNVAGVRCCSDVRIQILVRFKRFRWCLGGKVKYFCVKSDMLVKCKNIIFFKWTVGSGLGFLKDYER